MAVTNYYSVNGVLLGEKSGAGSRVDYLSDALGSVTATVNSSAAVVNTYRYKPYGTQLAKTGSGSDPAFTWVGQWGYRQTSRKFSDVYVRARHYSSIQAQWVTVDPLWPSELAYVYVAGQPTIIADPAGLACSNCCTRAREDLQKGIVPPGLSSHCTGGTWTLDPPKDNFKPCTTGSCLVIRERLNDVVAPNCKRFCKAASQPPPPSGPPTYGPSEPWWASAYCCSDNGIPKRCFVLWCVKPGDKPSDPCVVQCVSEHEKRHLHQPLWGCPMDNPLPPSVLPPKGNPPAWGECDAYQTEARCLLNKAKMIGCHIPAPLSQAVATCLGYNF